MPRFWGYNYVMVLIPKSTFKIYLPFEMYKQLVSLKQKTRINISEHIRIAIKEYLIRLEEKGAS
jgi:hypothetical protein